MGEARLHWSVEFGHWSFTLRGFSVSCPGMFLSVERQYHFGIFQRGLDMDRTLPKLVQVGERVLRVVGLELDAAVAVLEEQLAAVFVIGVLHVNNRPADIREVKQQPLLDLLEL